MPNFEEEFKKIAKPLGFGPDTTNSLVNEAKRFEQLEVVAKEDLSRLNGTGVPAYKFVLDEEGKLPENLKGKDALQLVLKGLQSAAKDQEEGNPEKQGIELAKKVEEEHLKKEHLTQPQPVSQLKK